MLIGGPAGDRIDGGAGRDLIFGDNVRLDRTIGDGMANARYRTLTGAEGGQIYSTLPGTAGTVLVNSGSSTIPGGGPVWEDFNIKLLDHDLATQTAAGNNFGNDYIAGGAGDDEIFGELGNDMIQGDGSIDLAVGATRLADGTLSVQPSVEAVDRRRRLHRGQRRQRRDLRQPRPGRHHRRQLEPVRPDDRSAAAGRRRPDLRRRRHRRRATTGNVVTATAMPATPT